MPVCDVMTRKKLVKVTSSMVIPSAIEAFIVGITNRLPVLLFFRTKVLCTMLLKVGPAFV